MIPLSLTCVMAVAGIETFALNTSYDLPQQQVATIALPGSPTRIDYQSLDRLN
jgi:hypothetical protein